MIDEKVAKSKDFLQKSRGFLTRLRMLTSQHVRRIGIGRIWICRRCFHAQRRLYAQQSSESSDKTSKGDVQPLSPLEAFRRRWAANKTNEDTSKSASGVADILRADWGHTLDERTQKTIEQKFTLDDLAEALKKEDVSRQYIKRDVWVPKPKSKQKEEGQQTLEEIEAMDELTELSRLDELESDAVGVVDVFGGEITRDYQGVIPLHGEQYISEQYPLKQGALVETRGYSPPPISANSGKIQVLES